MSKSKRPYDENIIKALQNLEWPIINYESKEVYVRRKARNENGFEHIAGKAHLLKMRDIELIPLILKNPIKVIKENRGRKGKYYIGLRKGVNKSKYLKVVTRIQENGTEEIVTIYSTKCVR